MILFDILFEIYNMKVLELRGKFGLESFQG